MNSAIRISLVLAAAVTTSHSAIVWSGIQDIVIPTDFNGIYVNFDTAVATTTTDNSFVASDLNFFFGGDGIGTGPDLLPVRSGTGATDTILPLPFDTLVDGSLNYGPPGFGASQGHLGNGATQFPSGAERYIGFQFNAGNAGTYLFGWMRVTLTNGSAPGVLHEWAFDDTPGAVIRIGTIPEPHLPVLALLGAAGIAARRRR